MPDTCAQLSRAHAYISRHKLTWRRTALGKFYVAKIQDIGVFDILKKTDLYGEGWSLYQAVLDYQRVTGKGWGS